MKTMMKKGMLALTSAACMLACAVPFEQAVSTGTAYIKPNAAAVQGQIGYLLGDLDFNNRVDMNDISILLDDYVNYDDFHADMDPSLAPSDYVHANIDGLRLDSSQPFTRKEDINKLDAVFLATYISIKMMTQDATWKDAFDTMERGQFLDTDRGELRLWYSNYLHDYILVAKNPPVIRNVTSANT